jgi:hypothetical protein
MALATVVLRVRDEDVTRPLTHQVAEVVQRPFNGLIAIATAVSNLECNRGLKNEPRKLV